MEPITIFAVSVGLVGVCRMTFVAADFFGKGIYSKGSNPVKYDEWYCFFKTSDLWGSKKQQKRSPVDIHQQQRRQQQRPRPRPEGGFH